MSVVRVLRIALVVVAAAYPLVFLMLALQRAPYPFALEWSESASLHHVQRILNGQPLYEAPTLDYVAPHYAPLYYYASAALARILPTGFLPLRVVSLLAALGGLALLAAIVHRETQSRLAALMAASMFAATFRASGGWMDVARVDSLFLLFLLLAVYALNATTEGRGAAAAGLCLALAFFTKQTAVGTAVLFAGALLLWDRRRLPWMLAGYGLPMIAGLLLLDRATDGWYAYFAFRPHRIISSRLLSFWTADLLRTVPVACLLGLVALLLTAEAPTARRRLLLGSAAALVGTGWGGRLVAGAVANALMPAFAGAAIAFGVGAHQALVRLPHAASPLHGRLQTVTLAALLVQLVILSYNPFARLPTRADRDAGQRLLRTIALTPGRLLVPHHPYLLVMAGKRGHAEYSNVFDVVTYGGGESGARLLAEARDALDRGLYDAVILDKAFMLEADVRRRYRLERPLWETEGAFVPVSGAPLKPESLWTRDPGGLDASAAPGRSEPRGSSSMVR